MLIARIPNNYEYFFAGSNYGIIPWIVRRMNLSNLSNSFTLEIGNTLSVSFTVRSSPQRQSRFHSHIRKWNETADDTDQVCIKDLDLTTINRYIFSDWNIFRHRPWIITSLNFGKVIAIYKILPISIRARYIQLESVHWNSILKRDQDVCTSRN